jgi:3-phenylpropionate/trans-cinnamate dioxygenase ferredoxin subunit
MTSVRIGQTGEVACGQLRRYEVDGVALCVAHAEDGKFYAVDDRCTHESVELSGGYLIGTEVECPMHGSRFDLITGEVCGLPADEPTKAYEVRVIGDHLVVEI